MNNKDWKSKTKIRELPKLSATDQRPSGQLPKDVWYVRLEEAEQEIEKAEGRGYKIGRQSFLAEMSISENMEKIERFFREAPMDYDDKCNQWFQFLEDLISKEE